jgi:hypothetical protein
MQAKKEKATWFNPRPQRKIFFFLVFLYPDKFKD